jgi:type IV pilus assembly protein PilP
MTARLQALLLLAGLALLAGCTSSDQEEVQQWMTEQRNGTRPRVQPIPEPKKFLPQAYTQEASIEPFSLQKLAQALKRESGQANANAALVTPELNRRKEPLESYPLDSMAMVGSLTRQNQPIALVRVENLIYQIRLGSYLGQNYGKVMKISETEVALREIVQDATGEWTERTALLQLQERSK